MIYGIGNDVVEVARVGEVFRRHGERFLERILGEEERRIHAARAARSGARGIAFLATRFAAKEAVAKALGLGMRYPMTWRSVEIVPARSGRPQALVHGDLALLVAERRLRLHVSVSDLESLAFATAIAETIEPGPA